MIYNNNLGIISKKKPLIMPRKPRGRRLPSKLRMIVGSKEGIKTLSAIAKRHKVDQGHLSHTIQGHRNTPRLITIIEQEWGLPIQEIRDIYREHKERLSAGNPVTMQEARQWYSQKHIRSQADSKLAAELLGKLKEARK